MHIWYLCFHIFTCQKGLLCCAGGGGASKNVGTAAWLNSFLSLPDENLTEQLHYSNSKHIHTTHKESPWWLEQDRSLQFSRWCFRRQEYFWQRDRGGCSSATPDKPFRQQLERICRSAQASAGYVPSKLNTTLYTHTLSAIKSCPHARPKRKFSICGRIVVARLWNDAGTKFQMTDSDAAKVNEVVHKTNRIVTNCSVTNIFWQIKLPISGLITTFSSVMP